jgi:ribosome recycling factor
MSEDEESVAQEDLQKVTDRLIREAEAIGKSKEAELLEV